MNKKLMSYIAPAAGAVLGNYLGPTISEGLGVSAPVGAGLGAALGGTAGGLAGGQSFGRSAGMGAIGGLGAGVLNALSGSAAPSTMGSSAGGSAGAGSAASAGGGGAGSPMSPIDLTAELGISPGQAGMLDNASAGGSMLPSSGGEFSSPAASLMPPGAGVPTAAAATAPADSGYGASSLGKIMTSLGLPQNSVTEAIAKNPNLLLAGGGLAANMLMGNQPTEGTAELKALAEKANQRGDLYSSYLQNGTLPPGAQAGLTQASDAAKAAIRSKYAGLNMSGSSAEMQELNDVDSRAQAQGFQMASNLLNTGVQESGLSANLYSALLRLNAKRDANTGRAISSFAAALNG